MAMSEGPVLVFFHPSRIALNMEVAKHPKLLEELEAAALNMQTDFGEILGVIAAHVGVAVLGNYTEDDINGLCDLLYHKLQKKRQVVIH